ncbi:uncharacterized protein P884DRAFT_15721 [Thermothelomyces heterothallicus CBS 202.75]|uniref:uncharacterized protein n=1 Tax=Thermothelomyces heterothallicus CBS 202.75 TaxID=1149848 RepID=UPI00374473B7
MLIGIQTAGTVVMLAVYLIMTVPEVASPFAPFFILYFVFIFLFQSTSSKCDYCYIGQALVHLEKVCRWS